MKPITLTDEAGHVTAYQLREGWHEVTLADFVYYQLAIAPRPYPRNLPPLAEWLAGIPESITARDVSLAAQVLKAAPWTSELPEGEAAPTITHEGTTYHHGGNLETLTIGKLEALLAILDRHRAQPAEAFPWLLSVLYVPQGVELNTAVSEATAGAFATLPVSLAWPAVAFFLRSSASSAVRIQQFSDAHEKTRHALQTLEAAMTAAAAGGSLGFLSRMQQGLVSRWIRSAKRMLNQF